VLLVSPTALAGEQTTREALDRLDELLELRISEGVLSADLVLPTVLVSAQPRYAESAPWFPTRAIEVVQGAFGTSGLRLCEACTQPRAWVEDGALIYQTGPVGLDEIIRLDDQIRGNAPAARTAIWIDEQRGGVSVRIVDLHTGRVLFAQNVDPSLVEYENTQRMYTLSEELERRARGDSLTQGFVDFGLYPGQHISIDWTDQWGETNSNLTGISLSVLDPVVGLGVSHYHRIPFFNVLLGGKLLVSLPTAVARSLGGGGSFVDPMLTGVAVGRVPFGRSNYGACVTLSTNGQLGLGLSLLNVSLLPVRP
jgi:hypothetical protein